MKAEAGGWLKKKTESKEKKNHPKDFDGVETERRENMKLELIIDR